MKLNLFLPYLQDCLLKYCCLLHCFQYRHCFYCDVPKYLILIQPYSLWTLGLAFSFEFILLFNCYILSSILLNGFIIIIKIFLLEENWILHHRNSLCNWNFYNLHLPSFLIQGIFLLLRFLMLNLIFFFQSSVFLFNFCLNVFFIDYRLLTGLLLFMNPFHLHFLLQHHLHYHYFFVNINLNYQPN
jgi:hypothetical protein